jgi:peptide deformylase
MIRKIVKDILFLSQKSVPATRNDIAIGTDLQNTLIAYSDRCVGMAANMIGEKKRVIVVSLGFSPLVMYNPVILSKSGEYKAIEGCLSLEGEREAVRYENIEVEYLDASWEKHREKYSGFTAQIIQHEMDHLEGRII